MKRLFSLFQSDAAGGIILLLAAALAVLAANTDLAPVYGRFVGASRFAINDFLMAIFFLLAGMEIKQEFLAGALAGRRAILPLVAAFCGMIVPALLYIGVVHDAPALWRGWAIPSATDIAFALGVLALFGSRAPASLKVLLMAIAVIDDLGAILVIAIFYTQGIAWSALGVAALAALGLFALNRKDVQSYVPYILMGFVLWTALLQSGVHPTIAGVVLGFSIPMSRLPKLEHVLKPYVVFGILPIFAFANAGVSLAGMNGAIAHSLTLAIAVGLVAGKQIGIFGSIAALVKTGLCALPDDLRWRHIMGLGFLCGIGFTMALFIGDLAFTDPGMAAYIRIGVITGSILSGLLGYTVLLWSRSRS